MADEKNAEEKCFNNNSIETNDANQKRERIVDQFSAAEQAEKIGQELSNLKELCKDEIRKQHAIDTIVRISIYMAQQYQKPDWHRFDILLIKHLRLLLDLQKDHRTDIEELFPLVSKIFWYFCGVDEIPHHFVNQLLDIWQQMLLKVDMKIKKSIFLTERLNFELCVMFMKRVGCYAMQRKMLNVILAYVDARDVDKFILVSRLFHVIGASTHEVYKRLVHLHRAVAAGPAAVESKKRFIIQIVNQFGRGTVVSKLIHTVWFDGRIVTLFPGYEAWLDFNLGSKTVEFCFCYEQERKMARIDKYCVGLFKVESLNTEYSSAFEIEMINPMHYETMTNTTAHDVILLTKIRIQLTYGILTEQLESILDILLPNKFVFTMPPAKKKKISTGHSNNDTESSDSENESTKAIEEEDLSLVEDNLPDPIPLQKLPKSPIKMEKLEIKANIKKETKVDLVDTSIPKLMNPNVTKRKTPKKSTLTTTETSVHYEVNIRMSQTKVEKLEPVPNSQPTQLLKDSTKILMEPTEDPPKPIEEFGQTEDISTAIDYDDILEATAIEEKNADSRDSDSCDETEMQSNEIVVKAMVHCDIRGNSQSSNKVPPKPDSYSQAKSIHSPNYDEIKSIDFDQRYFDEKVAKKIKIDPDSNKENLPQNKTSVIKEKLEPIIVESNNNKNKNQRKKGAVKKGRVTKPKPKPIFSKDESETKVRRSSRSSSMKAQQKISEQKDDVFEFDDHYDEFAVPELPKPKRKSSKGKSSTKNETKAPVKRAPAKKQTNDEPKKKRPRKLYNPMEFIEKLDDELQPQMVEKSSTSKIVPQLEDDQLTTASFESHDLNGMDSVFNRINKNLVRMDETTEAKKFDHLFETACYERGQMNESVTYSYRKFATKNSYSRVRMISDSADETQSKKLKKMQVEDE